MFPQHAMPQQSVLAVTLSRPLRAFWKSNKQETHLHFVAGQEKMCYSDAVVLHLRNSGYFKLREREHGIKAQHALKGAEMVC